MSDEDGAARRARGIAAGILAAGILAAASAPAQSLRGWGQVQYQNLNRAGSLEDQEWWLTSVKVDYATRIRQSLELASQVEFSEFNVTGRSDYARRPRGTLRLAHPSFGLFGSYRPDHVTDARNVTVQQQELMLSGYVQRAGLPRIDASWVRRHNDPNLYTLGSTTVTRSLSLNHGAGAFNVHGRYGDQERDPEDPRLQSTMERNYGVGSSYRLTGKRSHAQFQYDYTGNRREIARERTLTSQVHAAGLSGGAQLDPRSSLGLNYNFRHTESGLPGAPALNEHEGSLNLDRRLTDIVRASGGGGARGANVDGRERVESYAVASLAADGQARPGLRLGAGVAHSWSWLPGDRARVTTGFNANTRMHLAEGLEAAGNASISAANRRVAARDTVTSSDAVSVQTGAEVRMTPLRTIYMNASARRYRSGASLGGRGVSAASYSADAHWVPDRTLQVGGSWGYSGNLGRRGPDRRTLQADVQWNPSKFLEAAGTYTRTDSPGEGVNPTTGIQAGRETFGGRLVVALTRDLRTTIQYSEADPGRPGHAQQVNVTVTQSFRR